jgi:murein DD-endopeptidase MepM/ murein hydrolase activator NlpD
LFVLPTVFFLFTTSTLKAATTGPTAQTTQWTWPIDGNIIVLLNAKYGTTVENTDYAVKNLDLVHSRVDHITCFDVGWHRLYHAGADLYLNNGNTEGTLVKAVANGIVEYVDDGLEDLSVIIRHPNDGVWSVYWHLKELEVSAGNNVVMGQTIGKVTKRDYTGRFPDVHPYGTDDSHLHFEIRTFEDGGNLFPGFPSCNTNYPPGVGYTYPEPPASYGYLDPIQFLDDRIPDTPKPYRAYLPTILTDESCTEGENLIKYKAGFETTTVSNPAPWFEITTYFDPPSTYYYHIIDNDPFYAFAGDHSAFFGDQVFFARIVDEEMLQSVRIPGGVTSLEWVQYIKLEGPYSYGTDFGDRFIFALKDAETGISLTNDIVVDHTSTNYTNHVWLQVTININNAGALANRSVSPSYSSINDGDTTASTIRVDEVSLVTHCGGT